MFATDTAGVKVWEASYLPFGGVQASTGSNSELRFPGQWFQSESGLHQNWMREYDPTLGRYIQADPLGLVDGASVYGYALQNPGRYVDPRGERVDPSDPMSLGRTVNPDPGCYVEEAGLKDVCKVVKRTGVKHIAILLLCAALGEDPVRPRKPPPIEPPTSNQPIGPPRPPTIPPKKG